jgi:hypothetical protein
LRDLLVFVRERSCAPSSPIDTVRSIETVPASKSTPLERSASVSPGSLTSASRRMLAVSSSVGATRSVASVSGGTLIAAFDSILHRDRVRQNRRQHRARLAGGRCAQTPLSLQVLEERADDPGTNVLDPPAAQHGKDVVVEVVALRHLLTELLTARLRRRGMEKPQASDLGLSLHPQRGSNPCLHLERETTAATDTWDSGWGAEA